MWNCLSPLKKVKVDQPKNSNIDKDAEKTGKCIKIKRRESIFKMING